MAGMSLNWKSRLQVTLSRILAETRDANFIIRLDSKSELTGKQNNVVTTKLDQQGRVKQKSGTEEEITVAVTCPLAVASCCVHLVYCLHSNRTRMKDVALPLSSIIEYPNVLNSEYNNDIVCRMSMTQYIYSMQSWHLNR